MTDADVERIARRVQSIINTCIEKGVPGETFASAIAREIAPLVEHATATVAMLKCDDGCECLNHLETALKPWLEP